MEITASTHHSLAPARPHDAPAHQPPAAAPAKTMLADRFVSTQRVPPPAIEPQPAPESSDGKQLAQLANLSRLPHLMHLLSPVANVLKGVKGGAVKAVAHAHHGVQAMASSGGSFIARLGGPLSAIATGLSAVVAVFDIKRAAETLRDPQSSSRAKTLSTLQAGMSGFSGIAGLAAALGAAGLALPFSIPALLTASTVAGLGSFVVSLFNRHGSHEGHAAPTSQHA